MKKIRYWNWFIDHLVYILLVVAVVLFILYPYLSVFIQAFATDNNSIGEYISENIDLLKNSLFIAFAVTFVSCFLVISLTTLFIFISEKWQKFLRLILLITMVSPPFVTSLAYITLFGRRGFITHDLLSISYNPYGPQGIIMMESLSFASLNALVLIGMLRNIDGSIIKSARSLGAPSDAIVKDMFWPLLKPGLIVVALVSFIRSLADFQTPTIIGGSYRVLASEGYFAVISEGNIHKAALINLTLCIPALFGFYFYTRFEKNITQQTHGTAQGSLQLPKKSFFYPATLLVSTAFYALLLLQYLSIIINAITIKRHGERFLSLQPILESQDYLGGTVLRTVIYALIAGFIGSLLSYLIIYYSQVRKSRFMNWIELIGTLPYILPGTFFGLGYIYAFSKEPLHLTGTALIVVLNIIFKQLAFSTKAAKATVSQIDSTYFKTVHDLGGGIWNEWVDVFFPMSKHGFSLTFINGFISTMTTIGSIIFLIKPGQKVLTLVMFDVVQRGKYGIASVIACLIILICIVTAGAITLIFQFKERRRYHVLKRATVK